MKLAMSEIKTKYPVHELALMFPEMSDLEFEALVSGIRDNGLREPVTLWREAPDAEWQIIDGRHRALACAQLGIDPAVQYIPHTEDPVAYVEDKTFRRRSMTESQRAMVAAVMSAWSRPGGDRRSPDHSARGPNDSTQAGAAARADVGVRTVRRAAVVLAKGSPSLIAAVRSAAVTVRDAEGVCQQDHAAQDELLAMLAADPDLKTLANADARRSEQRMRDAGVFGPEWWSQYLDDYGNDDYQDELEGFRKDFCGLEHGDLYDWHGMGLPDGVDPTGNENYWTDLPRHPKARPVHEIGTLFPEMPEPGYRTLAGSMLKFGFLDDKPISTRNGRIVDGRAREKVALGLGLTPVYRGYPEHWTDDEVRNEMLSQNNTGAGWTPEQTAMTIAKMAHSKERRASMGYETPEAALKASCDSLGMNLSRVAPYYQFLLSGDPDLVELIHQGSMSLEFAVREQRDRAKKGRAV